MLVIDTSEDITQALVAGHGSRVYSDFSDAVSPVDPRFQLNRLDVGSIAAMFSQPIGHEDMWIDEAEGLVLALIDLLGYRTRGKTPEIVLLENLVVNRWTSGGDRYLHELVGLVNNPPMRRLGVFDLDTVISQNRRAELASALTALLESREFDLTDSYAPIDLGALLTQPDGSASANVLSFAHRSDDVRRFLAAVVFTKLRSYVRGRSGDTLFLLLYLDDGVSFLPAERQVVTSSALRDMIYAWDRFGVGVALVAEEPAQIDEYALDLCETWIVGRSPVGRARKAIIDELDLVNPPIDEIELDKSLKTLSAGQFVLRSPSLETLQYFQSPRS